MLSLMRSISLILLLCPFLLVAQAKNAEELTASNLKKYTIKSGQIFYQLSGDAEGDEKMVFDYYGWKSMRIQNMIFELYGIKTTQTLHEITDGDFVYRLNAGDSTMVVKKDYKWSQQAAYKEPREVSEALLFSLGGTLVSDSLLLGKNCQVWTFKNKALQELWVWNGLVLKRKRKLGDRIIYSTATKLELEINPDKTLFAVPKYIKEKK